MYKNKVCLPLVCLEVARGNVLYMSIGDSQFYIVLLDSVQRDQ